MHASVVNAGVLDDPITDEPVVGFVVVPAVVKLGLLRRAGRATIVFRAGWEWVAVEGPVRLVGPDEQPAGFPAERVPQLLRDVFSAAGGTRDDWAEYDQGDGRGAGAPVAVLIEPARLVIQPVTLGGRRQMPTRSGCSWASARRRPRPRYRGEHPAAHRRHGGEQRPRTPDGTRQHEQAHVGRRRHRARRVARRRARPSRRRNRPSRSW